MSERGSDEAERSEDFKPRLGIIKSFSQCKGCYVLLFGFFGMV